MRRKATGMKRKPAFVKHAVVLAWLLLTGCSTTCPPPVKVPIVAPCVHPRLPAPPHLPIYDLVATSPNNEVIKAYVASIDALTDYVKIIRGQS